MQPTDILFLLGYAVIGVGTFSVACSPVLGIQSVRARIEEWPGNRLSFNYILIVGSVLISHYLLLAATWQPLDMTNHVGRAVGIIVGYPVVLWLAVTVVLRLRSRRRPASPPMTLRTVGALGLGTILYIFASIALSFVVLLIGIFTSLPT